MVGNPVRGGAVPGTPLDEPAVNYCFCCGRRVNPQVDRCWFCSSPTRRQLRPPRTCPFCHERVRPRAVKCPHCNEFLDGRDRPSGGGGTTIIVQGMPGAPTAPSRGALPSASLPARGAVALPAPAPVAGRPLLDGPSNPVASGRLLSGPTAESDPAVEIVDDDEPLPNVGESRYGKPGGLGADESVLDVQASSVPALRSSSPSNLPAARGGEAPAGSGGAGLPAVRSDMPPTLPERIAESALPVVAALGRRLLAAAFPPKHAAGSDATTVEAIDPESRFRICENCASEILSDDNFCFHCGTQHRRSPFPTAPVARPKSNFWIHALVLVGLAMLALGGVILDLGGADPALSGPVRLGSGGGATLLAFWALLRKPGFMARLWSLLILLVCLAALFLFVPGALGS